jgi:hypothetical protein
VLLYGYLSNIDALSTAISLTQGGRPTGRFSGKASCKVPGWERSLGKAR